ncbi:hypothetical protein [Phormidesmis priestleyi]
MQAYYNPASKVLREWRLRFAASPCLSSRRQAKRYGGGIPAELGNFMPCPRLNLGRTRPTKSVQIK